MRCLVMVAALLVAGSGSAAAQELYVAPATAGGSDSSGTGAIGAPFETVQHALTQASSGTTIVLREGTYPGGVNIEVSDVTIRSYDGERGVISASAVSAGVDNTVWVLATGVTLENLDLEGGYVYALKLEVGDALVTGCRIHGSGRDCVKIVPGADHITIDGCEIYDSGVRDGSNAEGIDNVNADYMVVRDTFIHDTATNCAYAKGGARFAVFERLLVMRCGHAGLMLGQDTDEQWLDLGENPGYHESLDGVIRNCIIVDTQGAGIAMQAALRPKVLNNTLVHVAQTGNGGLFFASTPHAGQERVCEDAEVKNNIIVLGSGSARPMVFITTTGLTGGLAMDHNRFFHEGGSAVFWDERVPTYSWTLAQWQAGLGVDTASSEGDPGLDGSYHLASGSGPCVDNGETLAAVTDDYDGNPRAAPYDIGADEHGAGPALPTPPPAGTIGTGGGGSTGLPDGGGVGDAAPAGDAAPIGDAAPVGDAAPASDAGTSVPDGGSVSDASVVGDGGVVAADGATSTGDGAPVVDSRVSGACGCRAVDARPGRGGRRSLPLWALALAGLWMSRRRRHG